jgi:hypothetical protein
MIKNPNNTGSILENEVLFAMFLQIDWFEGKNKEIHDILTSNQRIGKQTIILVNVLPL